MSQPLQTGDIDVLAAEKQRLTELVEQLSSQNEHLRRELSRDRSSLVEDIVEMVRDAFEHRNFDLADFEAISAGPVEPIV